MKHNRYTLIALLILLLLLLSLPLLLKEETTEHTTSESYYHSRLAEQVGQGKFLIDEGISTPTPYHHDPYHYFLSPFVTLLGTNTSTIAVPLLLGTLALLFAFFTLRKLDEEKELTLFFFITTPLFLSFYTTLSSHGFALTLYLLATTILAYKKRTVGILVLFLFSLLSPLHTLIAVVTALLLACTKKTAPHKKILLGALFIVPLAYHLFTTGISRASSFLEAQGLFDLLFEFSGQGIGVIVILLALSGTYVLLQKRMHSTILLLILATILLSFFDGAIVPFALLGIAYLAAQGTQELFQRTWKNSTVKTFVILIIALSTLTASFTALQDYSTPAIDDETRYALEWLERVGTRGDVVFTHHSLGFAVQSVAKKKVMLDTYAWRIPNAEQAYLDNLELLHTYHEASIERIIEDHSIDYVLIRNDFAQGLIWDKRGRGLWFTTENTELFENVYDQGGVRIYQVA